MDKTFLTEILQMYKDGEQSLTDTLTAVEEYSLASNSSKPIVSGSLPFFHSVIESRIKHFESICHTYEVNELKLALSIIQRLIPPIMFEIGGGNSR